MAWRPWGVVLVLALVIGVCVAQGWSQPPSSGAAGGAAGGPAAGQISPGMWRSLQRRTADRRDGSPAAAGERSAGERSNAGNITTTEPARESAAVKSATAPSGLPNEQGQIWREYDISPYTLRVTTTRRPEQAIVDWILRETGFEAWHSETVAILSADQRTLRVYHTPQIQRTVGEIVDRFVNTQAESHGFNLRVVTIGSPNWREGAMRMLKPIPVQAQGVQAWLLNREDAAILFGELSKRSDFREHSSPNLLVQNGQAHVVGASRTRRYARSVLLKPAFPGYELEMGQLDEGFSLEFQPLVSLDGQSLDAVVKCQIQQIEKMIPINVEVPAQFASNQKQTIEVPQLASADLHERFRWPVDQVLLISRGVVATPVPRAPGVLPITLPGTSPTNRADALLFIQSLGKPPAPPTAAPNTTAAPRTGSPR